MLRKRLTHVAAAAGIVAALAVAGLLSISQPDALSASRTALATVAMPMGADDFNENPD
jgi:hypothetical protein